MNPSYITSTLFWSAKVIVFGHCHSIFLPVLPIIIRFTSNLSSALYEDKMQCYDFITLYDILNCSIACHFTCPFSFSQWEHRAYFCISPLKLRRFCIIIILRIAKLFFQKFRPFLRNFVFDLGVSTSNGILF